MGKQTRHDMFLRRPVGTNYSPVKVGYPTLMERYR